MKKHTSQKAYFQRLVDLSDIPNTSLKESKQNNLGELIDYERAANGVAYGIIREEHNYYIKKGTIKENLDNSDFVYIGGLENKTDYQYKKLSEAEKNRSMFLKTINESLSMDFRNKKLTEDIADDEIEKAEDKLDDLDAATDAEKNEPVAEPGDEMSAGLEAEPDDEPDAPVGDEPVGDLTGDGLPPEEMDDTDTPSDKNSDLPDDTDDLPGEEDAVDAGDPIGEVEKELGKLVNKIRKIDLEPDMVKTLVNIYLAAFKNKFKELDIEDRKEMADRILKVVPPEDVDDLGQSVEDEMNAEDKLKENNNFINYAEAMGYDSADSLIEGGEESVANMVSNFGNEYSNGENDGDLENVALVIKVVNPEILNKLKDEYGHDDYAEELEPYVNSVDESPDECTTKLNELFRGLGGIGYLGQKAAKGIKRGAQAVGNAVQQAGQNIKQNYHTGEKNASMRKLEGLAKQLNQEIQRAQNHAEKAGEEPINVQSLLSTMTAGIQSKGAADLNKFRTAAEGKEMNDHANIMVNENDIEPDFDADDTKPELDDDNTKPEFGFANDTQTLGGGVMKPDGAETTTVDVTVDGNDKTVNIAMNESEKKVRLYIQKYLEEKVGMRKPVLTEDKKSTKLKKLDELIDKQYEKYLSEGMFDGLKRVTLPDISDTAGIEKNFNAAYRSILTNPRYASAINRVLAQTSPEQKHALIQQYIQHKNQGSLGVVNNQFVYKPMGNTQFHKGQGAMARESVNMEEGLFGGVTLPDISDTAGIEKNFNKAYRSILTNPRFASAINRSLSQTSSEQKHNLIQQYIQHKNQGSLGVDNATGQLTYKPMGDTQFHKGQGAMNRE